HFESRLRRNNSKNRAPARKVFEDLLADHDFGPRTALQNEEEAVGALLLGHYVTVRDRRQNFNHFIKISALDEGPLTRVERASETDLQFGAPIGVLLQHQAQGRDELIGLSLAEEGAGVEQGEFAGVQRWTNCCFRKLQRFEAIEDRFDRRWPGGAKTLEMPRDGRGHGDDAICETRGAAFERVLALREKKIGVAVEDWILRPAVPKIRNPRNSG